jgi:hypothetical protein
MVDYSTRIRCAEELVVGLIDDILTEGGHMLWQKYLQRKAFPFAAETAADNIVSNLKMHFVPHDTGEAVEEDWVLEDEPCPGVVDSWARMHLDVRRPKQNQTESLPKANRDGRRLQTMRTRVSALRGTTDKLDKPKDEKSFPLKEEVQIDEEEEKLRNARQEEEARRRERENKIRANEKAKELEAQRVQALHEEMAKKPHNFDSEGGLIWVEEIKFDRLPKVQEVFGFNVRKDKNERRKDDPQVPTPKAKQQPQRRRLRFGDSRRGAAEDDFPDGFSKLQHGQPPILETMVVKAGVVLDVYGKSKAGPAISAGGGMSRKDYVNWTEKEIAYEAQFASTSDPSADAPGGGVGPDGFPTPVGSPPASRGMQRQESSGSKAQASLNLSETAEAATLGDTLPPIGRSQNSRATGGRGSSSQGTRGSGNVGKQGQGDGETKQTQMAPPAPSQYVRSKKMEAVGHLGRPPRLHVAPLGGPYGAVAQPPLGATMGHGLVRHASMKESYFFPHNSPELPSLLRASSEAIIGSRGRRSPPMTASRGASREDSRVSTAPETGSKGHIDPEDSPRHGTILVDKKNPAYRGMRQTLFPNTLSSTYVSGM